MESLITKLFLMSGQSLVLSPTVVVKHPTIEDVMAINGGFLCEDYYWSYVYTLLSDPYDNMVYLDDNGLDYETVSPLLVFSLRWLDAEASAYKDAEGAFAFSLMRDALRFFFGEREFRVSTREGKPILLDANDRNWRVGDDLYTVFADFLQKVHCISLSDRIRPANAMAKKILIDDMRMEQRRKKRDKKTKPRVEPLGDALVAALAGGSHIPSGANHHAIPIYPLLATSQAVQKKVIVQSMLNGIYTGMLKADKLPENELRWV